MMAQKHPQYNTFPTTKDKVENMSEKKKAESDNYPVSNFLLIKKLVDNDDGELTLVGTIVQSVFPYPSQFNKAKTAPQDNDESDKEDAFNLQAFEMRFNEESSDDFLVFRRDSREKMEDNVECLRSTYQLKAPMVSHIILDSFPFVIKKVTLAIELSTFDAKHRPTLLLDKVERRNTVSIQERAPGECMFEKLDHTAKYDFVSPFPEVEFLWDKKKKYCPRFDVSFYVMENGLIKFLKVTIPMILIATLNTVNVTLETSDSIDPSDFLANAATNALTAIFLVSDVNTAQPTKTKILTLNLLYTITVFVGLTCSSIPNNILYSNLKFIPVMGMYIVWVSFVFPLLNLFYFVRAQRKIISKQNASNSINAYFKDKTTKRLTRYSQYCFASESERDYDNLYELKDKGKFSAIAFR